ncbi:unnamed protein product, partial [Medioppia subpectinata]
PQVLRLGLILDYNIETVRAITNETINRLVDDFKQQLVSNVSVETHIISDFADFENDVEEDPSVCKQLMVIISALKCAKTKILYSLLRENCPSTLLLSVIENNCMRPPADQGLGFPVMKSINDIIPMLIDMKYDFMSEWDHIHLIHDHRLDTKTLDDLIKGLKGVSGSGIRGTTVTTYRLTITGDE